VDEAPVLEAESAAVSTVVDQQFVLDRADARRSVHTAKCRGWPVQREWQAAFGFQYSRSSFIFASPSLPLEVSNPAFQPPPLSTTISSHFFQVSAVDPNLHQFSGAIGRITIHHVHRGCQPAFRRWND